MTWTQFGNFASSHETVLILVATALASTMPEPGSPFTLRTLYLWGYDFCHQLPNIKRPTRPADLPAAPAQP